MFEDILFHDDRAAVRLAFHRACEELGIGTNADDTDRRDHLAMLILALAREGESEPALIQRKAVWQFRHPEDASVGQKVPVTRARKRSATWASVISRP